MLRQPQLGGSQTSTFIDIILLTVLIAIIAAIVFGPFTALHAQHHNPVALPLHPWVS